MGIRACYTNYNVITYKGIDIWMKRDQMFIQSMSC